MEKQSYLPQGSQEEERKREKGRRIVEQGQDTPVKGMSPVTSFLPPVLPTISLLHHGLVGIHPQPDRSVRD